ncbi:MAG: hypothetical protein ACRDF5_00100 [bacterium]
MTFGWRKRLHDESGAALAATLATIILNFLVSATLVSLAMSEYQTAGVAAQSRQAFQLAGAALARGTFEVSRDGEWDDGAGATAEHTPGDTATWYRLFDGAAFVDNVSYPASSPLGRITVQLRAVASGEYPGCNSETCIWVRATGRVRNASRRIEVLLGKITAADFTAYSDSDINVGAGGGGNGSFTLHGSLYIANCTNMVIDGQTFCVGLNMQGTGAILNDRPFFTDTPGVEPYHNRVYARGYVTGQGNSWQIGLDAQKMWGVHAAGWPPANDNQIDAYRRDDAVPIIPFADPSQLIAARKAEAANALVAYECTRPGGICTAAQWQQVDLTNATATLLLRNNAKVVIPDQSAGTDCTTALGAVTCNLATPTPLSVDGAGNFSMVFNGYLGAGVANMATQRDAYIHMNSRVEVRTDLLYQGTATFLVENSNAQAVEIRSSVTPVCAVSQGSGCSQTFGQPGGHTYAFAVDGGMYVRGAGLEMNVVLLAHDALKNDNPQDWYGLFIADELDFDNNPQIYPVSGLKANLPPGIGEYVQSGAFGVVPFLWRELF